MVHLFALIAIALLTAAAGSAAGAEPEPFDYRWAPSQIMTSPCGYDTASFVQAAKEDYGVTMTVDEDVTEGVFFTVDGSVQTDPDQIVTLRGGGYTIVLMRFTDEQNGIPKYCMLSAHRKLTEEELKLPPSIRHKVLRGDGDAS